MSQPEGEKEMEKMNVIGVPEGIFHSLGFLPVCPLMLYLLACPLSGADGQTGAGCRTAGQVFGWDVLGHTLTLKSDSGRYSDFRYDDRTTFTEGDASVRSDELGMIRSLNIDDRLCVEAFWVESPEVASRVRVTSRTEIDARDKGELVHWQGNSVFGTIRSLDPAHHRITVSGLSSEVSVDAAGPVAFWIMPKAARAPAAALRGSWASLATGDNIYVHGDRVPGMRTMRAALIVSGGFRSLAGSVESMEPLESLLRLRDFRSGRSREIHFDFMSIYIVGRTVPGADNRRLYPANIGDLKRGDSVLILGIENRQTGGVDAFQLITGFSPGGLLQPGAGQSADWIFRAAGFGGSRP
jgi:hypothetical protein